MPLLINKDGKQLGPYSLDEARELVLSGKLDALDWAWPDGGTDWVHLKDVPGYVPSKPVSPGPAARAATGGTGTVIANTPLPAEETLWRGRPSQYLNLGIYLCWGAVIVATLVMLGLFFDSQFWGLVILGAVVLIALINCGVAFFHLHAIEYIVSTQRVRIISGVFSKNIQEIELFRVKDSAARQSFYLRLFGLGTITILSGDENQPRLILSGIPRPIELRERLRQEVMNLRQRFGVREVDVM